MMQLTTDIARELTVRWEDPAATRMAMTGMSGFEAVRAYATGRFPRPPLGELMDLSVSSPEPGSATFEFTPTELFDNPMGTLHGGIIGTLLDSAMGMAVLSTLEPGAAFTTMEYKVNFLRPVTVATGRVFAEGTVLHAGRSQAVAEGRLMDAGGKLYAIASTTCAVFGRPANGAGK